MGKSDAVRLVLSVFNDVEMGRYLVRDGQRELYAAPAPIKAAYFLIDRVLVVYDGHGLLPHGGDSLRPEYLELTDKEIELAGQNVLMVGNTGEILWRIRASRPSRPRSAEFGYTSVSETDGVWTVYCRDRHLYKLDIETGQLSDPAKYC